MIEHTVEPLGRTGGVCLSRHSLLRLSLCVERKVKRKEKKEAKQSKLIRFVVSNSHLVYLFYCLLVKCSQHDYILCMIFICMCDLYLIYRSDINLFID